MRIATIDIGTNTILLLVCDLTPNSFEIIEDHHRIARLGEGVDSTGFINNDAKNRAIELLEFYKDRIDKLKPEYISAVATSAMRDAKNSLEIKSELEKIISAEIEIITGEEEAKLSFLGSSENQKSVVLDIGGGSTEVIAGFKDELQIFESFNIGAVRLTERFDLKDKDANKIRKAQKFVEDNFRKLELNRDFSPIAVAGTPNTMAMINLDLKEYSREKLHNYNFSLNDITKVKEIIIQNQPEELIKRYNVHPNRADIILGGAIILEQFLISYNYQSITVSSNGLRFGLATKIFNNNFF